MVHCWAESLGTCSGKQSGEHYFSKSLFPGDAIKVCGFPWCKDQEMAIGMDSAVAKILCTKHNADLSPLDNEARRMCVLMREMETLRTNQSKHHQWQIRARKWSSLLHWS